MDEEPLTEELLRDLLASPNPVDFIDRQKITGRSLPEYLNELLEAKGLERAAVIRAANLNETFGYQIFMGQRNASRNKVLQLAFGLQCTLQEANRLLQAAGHNELYCKDRRDAIILFCIDRGRSLLSTNEQLYEFGEDTIC
jgi:hypothetical protein